VVSEPYRSLLRALGGVAVAVALLGSVELGLRVVGIPDPGLYAGDPATVWWLRPGLDRRVPGPGGRQPFELRTNALGMRGPLPPAEGPWTLALGCSTTFGWGVEEQEAWPAQLSGLLEESVINGGQPGWSTHQAIAATQPWMDLGPSRVVLAFIVRDAQLAARPDHRARPSPWLWRSQLGRGLQALLMRNAGPARPVGGQPRVPPGRFAQNLSRLVEMAGEAQVVLLAFPQREPSQEHLAAMASVGPPLLAPRLAPERFFPSDPLHLDAQGHRELAEWLADNLP
jgi:hypothetical protein